jgi:hypothetical protein
MQGKTSVIVDGVERRIVIAVDVVFSFTVTVTVVPALVRWLDRVR